MSLSRGCLRPAHTSANGAIMGHSALGKFPGIKVSQRPWKASVNNRARAGAHGVHLLSAVWLRLPVV